MYQTITVLVSAVLIGWLLTKWDKSSAVISESLLAQEASTIKKEQKNKDCAINRPRLEQEVKSFHEKIDKLNEGIAELKEMLKSHKPKKHSPSQKQKYDGYSDRVIACQEEAERKAKKDEDSLPTFRHPEGFACSTCSLSKGRWDCGSDVKWP